MSRRWPLACPQTLTPTRPPRPSQGAHILETIAAWDPERQSAARAVIREMEREALVKLRVTEGVLELVRVWRGRACHLSWGSLSGLTNAATCRVPCSARTSTAGASPGPWSPRMRKRTSTTSTDTTSHSREHDGSSDVHYEAAAGHGCDWPRSATLSYLSAPPAAPSPPPSPVTLGTA